MDEIIFIVTEAPDGGFTARALGEAIFTQAGDVDSLRAQVRDAVRCHFDEGAEPQLAPLHVVRDEVLGV